MSSLNGETSARKSRSNRSLASWPARAAALAAVAYALIVAGCAGSAPTRVTSGQTRDEVANVAGRPSVERTLPDGTKAWYFVQGPGGYTTYRVRFQQDGRVIDNVQLLNESNFTNSLIAGKTSESDVLDNLGPPGAVNQFRNLNEIVWTYRWMNVQQPYFLLVHLDQTTRLLTTYSTQPQPCPSLTLQC